MWILTLVGVALLYRADMGQRKPGSGRELIGGMLAGWGAFNFVEGLIDHQIFGLHHVLPGHPNEFLFDMLFLASGLFLLAAGWWVIRTSHRAAAPQNF
jgi:uncharacterized membrane protein